MQKFAIERNMLSFMFSRHKDGLVLTRLPLSSESFWADMHGRPPARQEYGLGLGHNNQGFHEGERGTNNHARTRGVYWDFPSKQWEARSVGINHMATRISA